MKEQLQSAQDAFSMARYDLNRAIKYIREINPNAFTGTVSAIQEVISDLDSAQEIIDVTVRQIELKEED